MVKDYFYDEETMAYRDEAEATLDPRKSERLGKDCYLEPANSTRIAPPKPEEGYVAVFNGEGWDIKQDNRNKDYYDVVKGSIERIKNFGNYIPLTEEDKEKIYKGMKVEIKDGAYHFFWNLDELKEKKIEELKNARDQEEQNGFEYLGKVFDSDQVSVQRLTCAAQTAQVCLSAGQPFSIIWTCKDNTTIELDAEQMIGTIHALAQFSHSLHEKCTALKEQVRESEDVDEIEAIHWRKE